MTEAINFSNLQNEFNAIKKLYSNKNYKYIHAKTIDNFIFFADSFFLNKDKEEIYRTLSEYFSILNSTEVDNVHDSLKLFKKYIAPLTSLYIDLKGFHLALKFWIISISTLSFFLILYLVKAPNYYYIGLGSIFIILVARQLYYGKKKMIYGFLY